MPTIMAGMQTQGDVGPLSSEAFLALIQKVSGFSYTDLVRLAESGSPWDLRLTRLAIDSLALLELQLEIEEHTGQHVDFRRVSLSPETTVGELFQAVST